jgi:hypothetical protein
MVVDNKGAVTYVRVLKEDLAIIRVTPSDGPVPDFKAGQFVTLGPYLPAEGHILLLLRRNKKNILNCLLDGYENLFQADSPLTCSIKKKATKSFGSNPLEYLLLMKRCMMDRLITGEWF